jgi:hypothetical protein
VCILVWITPFQTQYTIFLFCSHYTSNHGKMIQWKYPVYHSTLGPYYHCILLPNVCFFSLATRTNTLNYSYNTSSYTMRIPRKARSQEGSLQFLNSLNHHQHWYLLHFSQHPKNERISWWLETCLMQWFGQKQTYLCYVTPGDQTGSLMAMVSQSKVGWLTQYHKRAA